MKKGTVLLSVAALCVIACGCDRPPPAAPEPPAAAPAAPAAPSAPAAPAAPAAPGGGAIRSVHAASLTTCALMGNGTVRCWGGNLEGQLGVGDKSLVESYVPVEVKDLGGVERLWAEDSYCWSGSYSDYTTDTVCAQQKDGTTRCFGHNDLIYGDNTRPHAFQPVPVDALKGVLVWDAHCGAACAVMADATVRCWGSGPFGNLGDGTHESRDTPVQVKDLTGAAEVGCGQNHCCARKTDGTVWCWGSGGALGDGTHEQRDAPVQAQGIAGAVGLAVTGGGGCAVDKAGDVRCWGDDFGNAPAPVEGASGVAQIAGGGFVCGLKKDGAVLCWGPNDHGQLGDGTREARGTVARPVQGLAGALQVSVGLAHACALLPGDEVRCWGWNSRGQLGDATLADSAVPVVARGVAAAELAPLPADKVPTAVPADGKRYAPPGKPPKGCQQDASLAVRVGGQPRELVVRVAGASLDKERMNLDLAFADFDFDLQGGYTVMCRGQQLRASMTLQRYGKKKVKGGEDEWVRKPLDKGKYEIGYAHERRVSYPGVFDRVKQHGPEGGKLTITWLDKSWVCGEIDLGDATSATAIKGKFALPLDVAK